MRILFIIVVFLFSCNSLIAQLVPRITLIDLGEMASKTTRPASQWQKNHTSFIEGSQYLDENWGKGTLIMNNDTLVEGLDFRYNIYAHEMQIKINKDTLAFTRPDLIRTLVFNNRTFVYGDYMNNMISGKDYFELLVDGKCKLLLKREITFLAKNPPVSPLSGGYENDRLILKDNIFYLQSKGSVATFVKSNKRSFLSQLGDHQSELIKFIKDEKIHFTDKKDVTKLIIYYNNLN